MENLIYLKRTLKFMKVYKVPYAIGMFLYSVQGYAFNLIMAIFSAGVMAAIIAGSPQQLIDTSILTLIMFAGFGACLGAGVYLLLLTIAKVLRELRRKLLEKFTARSLETSQSIHSGESLAALNTDVNTVNQMLENIMFSTLGMLMLTVFSAITIFIIDWRLGLAGLAIGAILFMAQKGFTKPLARLTESRLANVADAVKHMSNMMAAALPIRAYNMQQKALQDFETPIGTIKIIDFKIAFISMWQNIFTTLGGWLSLITTFVLGGWLVIEGEIEFATLMMLPPLMTGIAEGVGGLGQGLANFQGPLVAAKRVFDIIDSPQQSFHKNTAKNFDGYNLAIK
ncbi:MAG: ABC transporter transmembrane domain-containing protein, partial [Defluviitaleaceae bacterium]|nr:ABC transporter transmembrane domain-containing protein [Defluviitaleaceae bacterium]